MKLVDLAFIINPDQKVQIIVRADDPERDDKVINADKFWKVGYGNYEVMDIHASDDGNLVIITREGRS